MLVKIPRQMWTCEDDIQMQLETTEILSIATELLTSARRWQQLSHYYLEIPSRAKIAEIAEKESEKGRRRLKKSS